MKLEDCMLISPVVSKSGWIGTILSSDFDELSCINGSGESTVTEIFVSTLSSERTSSFWFSFCSTSGVLYNMRDKKVTP